MPVVKVNSGHCRYIMLQHIPFRSVLVGGFCEAGMPRPNDAAARTTTKTDMVDFIWTKGGPCCGLEVMLKN